MKKTKLKPISSKTIKENKTLSSLIKEEPVDKTKGISKLAMDLMMKLTKKR